MRRLLQSIIYNRKLYDRPQDEWVCGRAAEGCPCVFGPGSQGECRATSQCLPAKQGDRWVCTRPISLGAACATGPRPDGACGCPVPPCWPQRSLRAQRRRLTWLVASLALGVVVLALWGWRRMDWSNPGPLTSQHAMSAQRCSDCHLENAHVAFTGSALAARQAEHNQLCLQCHDLGPQGNSPHGVASAQLAALGEGKKSGPGVAPMVLMAAKAVGPGGPADLACAACHQEHQGRNFDLNRMGDQQCQVCHQAQFESFASGHPEFSAYPYERRTRIQFDHVTHWQKHFVDARMVSLAPTSCAQCHEPALDGGQMLVRGYEQTCANCHSAQINGDDRAGLKGLVFLRLPAFDLAALEAAGAPVGEWPAYARGGLTPFMRWMLEQDAATRAALDDLGAVNLADLSAASRAQKAAAAQVFWGVKGLLADLITQGQPAIIRRARASAPDSTPSPRRTGQFSADSLLAAQQVWLPNLLREVAAYRRGEKPARPAPMLTLSAHPSGASVAATAATSADPDDLLADPVPKADPDDLLAPDPVVAPPVAAPVVPAPAGLEFDDAEARVAEGGWYRRDEEYELYYRPGGHADPFLTAWLEATVNEARPTAQAIFSQLAAERAPGVCMKCHTVDQTETGAGLNWLASRPQPGQREFTRFKHAAHFSLMGDQGCSTCHGLDIKADYVGGFGANRDSKAFHSNFFPMAKNTCVTCHQPARAGASCQQCHNYHTGDLKSLRLKAAEYHAAEPPAPKTN
jgi:hypothetical protein